MRIGEPVYKKTFTKPLPDGAKVFSRKHIKYAQFKDTKGRTQELPLTKDGKKIRCETSSWYIRFDDHNGIRRTVKAYTDKSVSDYLYGKIQEFIAYRYRKHQIPADLQEYLEQDAQIRQQLVGFGLLEEKPRAENLDDLVEKFGEYITRKERGQRYIDEVMRTLRIVFTDCNFGTWDDIDSDVIKKYLDERRNGGKGIGKGRYNGIVNMLQYFCRWHTKKLKKLIRPLYHLRMI